VASLQSFDMIACGGEEELELRLRRSGLGITELYFAS
jgi:hypothetical protein